MIKISALLPALQKYQPTGEPTGETILYQREMAVYTAIRHIISLEQPCCLGGKYSWLTSPETGAPLQIDLFFPRIVRIAKVDLNTPRALAIEVQSSLHDGKWNNAKKRFFKNQEDFEHYTRNQEWKREQLLARKIPFLELDPAIDDLSPAPLRHRLGELLGILL